MTALAGVLTSLVFYTPALAAEPVLSRIDVEQGDRGPEIHVLFETQVTHLSHVVVENGRGVEIQVQLPSATAPSLIQPGQRETLRWEPSASVPLETVEYTPDVGSGSLLLRFSAPVTASVRGGNDLRSIVVTLVQPAAASADLRSAHAPLPEQSPAASAQSTAGAKAPPSQPTAQGYFVVLASGLEPFDVAKLPQPSLANGARVTTLAFHRGGRNWHRLLLGPFPARTQAQVVADANRRSYPQAWVVGADKLPLAAPTRAAAPTPPAAELPAGLPPPSEQRLAEIYQQGRKALTAGELARAIQLFTKLVSYSEHPYRRDALELLGLARERNGQLAHARAEYEHYLQQYPTGEGADRVRQRLAGIVALHRELPSKLRPAAAARGRQVQWDVFGSLSQYYRYDQAFTDLAGEVYKLSTLSNDLYLAARRRGERYDLRSQLTAGLDHDFGPDATNDSRVSEVYLDASPHGAGLFGRVGRQSRSTGGVLGRFDGGLFGYAFNDHVRLNVNAGFPVDASTIDTLNTDRVFYGASVDLTGVARHFDFNIFGIQQEVASLVDRQAAGAEARYIGERGAVFALVDYDTFYRDLNIALLFANATFADRTTVHASADVRKSPSLATSNALIGQPVTSIDDLRTMFTDDEIEQLARDRTAEARSFNGGITRPISERLQVSFDATMSSISDTPASGGVAATPDTGDEFFYDLQLIGTNLLAAGDITILGLRYQDGSLSDLYSAILNTRYPFSTALRFNPRLQLDYRPAADMVDSRLAVKPSARLEYRWTRRLLMEVEAGAEFANETTAGQSDRYTSYFATVGYRWDF